MKRIWTSAKAHETTDGWQVLLDGKPIKKPSGTALLIPFPALAEAIAAEWRGAGLDGGDIKPDDLPLTRMATTAIDRVAKSYDEIINQLVCYGLNDALCYRAETPVSLAALEQAQWQPWLNWAEKTYNIPLNTGFGITPVVQPPDTVEKFGAVLQSFDIYQLTALGVAVPAMGSLVLGLALATGQLDAPTAFEISHVEEKFQIERWGTDELAEERRLNILTDLHLCVGFIALCDQKNSTDIKI
jgi:chaperone required for assembly of F1-ATPase